MYAMYLVIRLTTCEISRRVQIMAYMMLPTSLEYGTLDICFKSSSIFGDIFADNLKWVANKVVTSFVLLKLKHYRTFLI